MLKHRIYVHKCPRPWKFPLYCHYGRSRMFAKPRPHEPLGAECFQKRFHENYFYSSQRSTTVRNILQRTLARHLRSKYEITLRGVAVLKVEVCVFWQECLTTDSAFKSTVLSGTVPNLSLILDNQGEDDVNWKRQYITKRSYTNKTTVRWPSLVLIGLPEVIDSLTQGINCPSQCNSFNPHHLPIVFPYIFRVNTEFNNYTKKISSFSSQPLFIRSSEDFCYFGF